MGHRLVRVRFRLVRNIPLNQALHYETRQHCYMFITSHDCFGMGKYDR